MTFYLFFLIYLGAGILICGALFYWAISNGQFKDQDRARYFPLAGESPQPKDASSAKWPLSMTISLAVILSALIGQIVIVLVLSLSG
ncbi:MAG: hypothetical protein ACWGSD_12500 [Thermodesulfobacteriota bacterium]